MIEYIYKSLGDRIRRERLRVGITQEKLAELTDLSTAFIGQIERGDNRASLITIEKIANALDVSVSSLFKKLPARSTTGSIGSTGKHTRPKPDLSKQLSILIRDKDPSIQKFLIDLIKKISDKIIQTGS